MSQRNLYLKTLIIPNTISSIGEAAFYKNNLTNIEIPSTVTFIGAMAFNRNNLSNSQEFIYARNHDGTKDKTHLISYGGTKEDNIKIPENVIKIGEKAFEGIDVNTLTISTGVAIIENNSINHDLIIEYDENASIDRLDDSLASNGWVEDNLINYINCGSTNVKQDYEAPIVELLDGKELKFNKGDLEPDWTIYFVATDNVDGDIKIL